MISKFVVFYKFIIFSFINSFLIPKKKIISKTICLIRTDAIGDYILFRNFIEVLANNEKYKNYKITLVGNELWKDIALHLDSEFISNFIWINNKQFLNNLRYRYNKLKEICYIGYEIALSPSYRRTFFSSDSIIHACFANHKVGSVGDPNNIRLWQRNVSNQYYNVFVPTKKDFMFEFYRNKEFFENFLKMKININRPVINLKMYNLPIELPKKYCILFIGANASRRRWSVDKFAKVGEYLKKEYGYSILICGSKSDLDLFNEYKSFFNYEYINLIGKTSLVDLLYVIGKCDVLISNETGAPHMAIAIGRCKVFVVSNANHFGRFTPYPNTITSNYHVVYPFKYEHGNEWFEQNVIKYGIESQLNINDINFSIVRDKIDQVLNLL